MNSMIRDSTLLQYLVFVCALGVTSASLSSGYIWACGSPCIVSPTLWQPGFQTVLVFIAAFTAWWGYLIAHYIADGILINQSGHTEESNKNVKNPSDNDLIQKKLWSRRIGALFGISILIVGMVVGVFYIRQGNHLMTNIGGALFLGGYVIAHQLETGKPL